MYLRVLWRYVVKCSIKKIDAIFNINKNIKKHDILFLTVYKKVFPTKRKHKIIIILLFFKKDFLFLCYFLISVNIMDAFVLSNKIDKVLCVSFV